MNIYRESESFLKKDWMLENKMTKKISTSKKSIDKVASSPTVIIYKMSVLLKRHHNGISPF